MSATEVKHLTTNDTQAAADFFIEQLDGTFTNSFPVEAILKAKQGFGAEQIAEFIESESRVMLGAFNKGEVKGIMFGSHLNGGVASVIWIAVSSDLRGEGIGRQLMQLTFDTYQKLGAHKLVLYTETLAAKKFYERIGMTQEGFHPSHWWGVDHYCFGKQLGKP